MRQAVLLGVPGTKRTWYFKEAAVQERLDLRFLDWKNWREMIEGFGKEGIVLKIDPPVWNSCILEELNNLSEDYNHQLKELVSRVSGCNGRFWNHPFALMDVQDKALCKTTLAKAGLPVTELLAKTCGDIQTTGELLELMENKGISQVFIKPLKGSGAAGVSALRWHRRTGKAALYTCALEVRDKGIVNTRRLRRFSDRQKIFSLLDRLFLMECVIERWHGKAGYQGYSYDLRAVVQDGRIDYLLARLSKGPITNLHLNNCPLDVKELNLPAAALEAVRDVSLKAAKLYPGLSSAGIDILLEKGSLRPRIIEMNGQGDLIYQDIYRENIIYRRQAALMKKMAGERVEEP